MAAGISTRKRFVGVTRIGFVAFLILFANLVLPASGFAPAVHAPQQRSRPHQSSLISSMAISSNQDTTPGAECSRKAKDHFRGQRVLLTGASGGLGRSLALQLSRCGVSTLVISGRNMERLKEVAEECKKVSEDSSLDIQIFACDLGDADSVIKLGKDALEAVPRGIDILINNAGVASRSTFLETKLEVDEVVMQINFLSGVSLAKALVPSMVDKKKGAVIWISGIQGLVGIPNRSSNVASKFAIQGYCEALRGELASSGVTVHVASPGYIRTNLSYCAVLGNGEKYGKLDETTANGADPNDVAVSILNSVAKGKADFVVASSTSSNAAIWLRLLAPSVLNSLLAKRYQRSLDNKE